MTLSLGLGVGANAASFRAFNAAFLRPLPFRAEGRLVRVFLASPSREPLLADNRLVDGHLMQAMRMRLLAGRFMTDAELERGEQVAVVSRNLARAFWPNENPIGKRPITIPLMVSGTVPGGVPRHFA